jgi:hypothetical protein
MSNSKPKADKGKYTSQEQLDPELQKYILEYAKDEKLPCAVAFQIVEKKNIPADEIGMHVDFMKIRLAKCQLGLFGYQPEKKIVKKGEQVGEFLEKAIHQKAIDKRLSCIDIWQIASELGVAKLAVSNACETLSIKIHSCQLGAF